MNIIKVSVIVVVGLLSFASADVSHVGEFVDYY